jgi:hypothetical protein
VLVYDYGDEAQMSDEDRALWATNFHGRVAETGFLVLDAEAPLRLAAAGEHAGRSCSSGLGQAISTHIFSSSPASALNTVKARGSTISSWSVGWR